MITFSLLFKILCGWFVLDIIWYLIIYIKKDKYIHKFRKLPAESRELTIKVFRLLIITYKIFLWASPIYLIVLPVFIYKNVKQDSFYVIAMLFMVYFLILTEFLYRRSLLKEISSEIQHLE